MTAAAEVIVRPLAASPSRAACRPSPVRSHSSWMRVRRNTSVVHREAEQDDERERGHPGIDRARAAGTDQRSGPSPLEDGDQHAKPVAPIDRRFMMAPRTGISRLRNTTAVNLTAVLPRGGRLSAKLARIDRDSRSSCALPAGARAFSDQPACVYHFGAGDSHKTWSVSPNGGIFALRCGDVATMRRLRGYLGR